MSNEQTVRDRVAEDYTSAVQAGGSCCSSRDHKGVAVRHAGYAADDLAALPADAVANAFGCGNPVALSGLRPGDVVVDLGSGAGIDLLLAARRVGPEGRVIGIDMTDAMIERASANVKAAGLENVEVLKGIIEQMPVETASADWVISNCVVNLSPEKHRVFAEIARVLKPGGRVMISDMVVEDLPRWVRDDPRLFSGCIGGAISEPEYVAGLRAAGLVDVEVTGRFVYEQEHLQAADPGGTDGAASCCGGAKDGDRRRLAAALAGKVWSANFRARKPG